METKVCTSCGVEKSREDFFPRNKGKYKIQAKCRLCCSAMAGYQREWRAKNQDKARNFELKRTHGITLSAYEEVLEIQGGVCAICKRSPGEVGSGANSQGRLAVDHNHRTGQLRGLLCTNCNLGLGSFFENPSLLLQAAVYLKMWHGRPARAQEEAEALLQELMNAGP